MSLSSRIAKDSPRPRWPWRAFLLYLVALVAVPMAIASATDFAARIAGLALPAAPALALLENAKGREFFRLMAIVAVAAPVLEELFFRGLAFLLPVVLAEKFFARAARGIAAVSALASSSAFMFVHYLRRGADGGLEAAGFDNAFLALFAFGLMQCWCARRHFGLLRPMLAHSFFNLANVALYFAARSA